MNSFDGPKDRESRKKLNKLENIKNTFFLQIMFDYILKNKYFGMIKYNKNMQKKRTQTSTIIKNSRRLN